jgi:hypothetical protein
MKYLAVLLLSLLISARAHVHNGTLSEGDLSAPVDTLLWLHIAIQIGVWGFLFPAGMVLGITRSRWHVPLQVKLSLPRRPVCGLCIYNKEHRIRPDSRWISSRSHSRWTQVLGWGTLSIRVYPTCSHRSAIVTRNIFKAAYT